jgi:xylulokinase
MVGSGHTIVLLDGRGAVLAPSPLGVPSHRAATHLITTVGTSTLLQRVGQVPVPDTPVALLRWWCQEQPAIAQRLAAVALPHEWLAWRLRGDTDVARLVTDRSSASLTGWFDPNRGCWDEGVLGMAAGREVLLPRVLLPGEDATAAAGGLVVASGASLRGAAALCLALRPGDTVLDLSGRGVAYAVVGSALHEAALEVSVVSDAQARLLCVTPTGAGASVLAAAAATLGLDGEQLAQAALFAPPGAGGVVFDARAGTLSGLTEARGSQPNAARAVIEGVLAAQLAALQVLARVGARTTRVLLTGAAARNAAVVGIAPMVLPHPVAVPLPSDHAVDGAAMQAAWALHGAPPAWVPGMSVRFESGGTSAGPSPSGKLS